MPEDIVIVSSEPKPCLENRSSWEQQHMEEINAVFGKDMSGYVLAIYDKLEEIEDDFENYAHNTDYCRKVLDKWVFVMAWKGSEARQKSWEALKLVFYC